MTLRLGLRLVVAGGRESFVRLAFTAIGVAAGVLLLLAALAGQTAIERRAERVGWQDAAYAVLFPPSGGIRPTSADGALFLAVTDYHDGTPMVRAYVAALGADPPLPPGLRRLPGPGEVALSPALRRLLAATPADRLGDRFPGRDAMTIGPAGLGHPDELVAVIGRTPEQLTGVRSVQEVRSFAGLPNGYAYFVFYRIVLLAGAVVLLLPVVVLIVMVTRVSAAQREQRLAVLRLAGATRSQTAVVAAVETGLGAVAGALLAWAGFLAARPLAAAAVTFDGGHFYPADLAVPPGLLAAVLAGAPLLAVLATVVSLRRVQVGPLGISRRGRLPAPSAWRALPAAAGLGGLLALGPLRAVLGEARADSLLPWLMILQIGGLVLAGPWLALVAGRGLARVSRRAPALIAARRIALDPYATFRAVSGVVLAAWAATFIASTAARTGPPDSHWTMRPGVVVVHTGGVPAERVAPLLALPGAVATRGLGGTVVACADLARVREVSCPHPAGTERVEPPPGPATANVAEVYLPTDGTLAAQDRLRTRAAGLVPNAIINTEHDPVDSGDASFPGQRELVQAASVFVLLVGACGLAVGVLGGLVERRRPFALLRAAGMRLDELRRVVLLETTVTMVATSALGAGLGVLTAYAAGRHDLVQWQWPGPVVLAYVAAGILAALVFSAGALPLLGAVTRHETVRYE